MKIFKNLIPAAAALALVSCTESSPKEITVGKDQCENCKMTITAPGYATQLITSKGRVYIFDDISCMTMYEGSNPDKATAGKTYVADFPTGQFMEKDQATLIKGGEIRSPMGGNTQAFKDRSAAEAAAAATGASLIN